MLFGRNVYYGRGGRISDLDGVEIGDPACAPEVKAIGDRDFWTFGRRIEIRCGVSCERGVGLAR